LGCVEYQMPEAVDRIVDFPATRLPVEIIGIGIFKGDDNVAGCHITFARDGVCSFRNVYTMTALSSTSTTNQG